MKILIVTQYFWPENFKINEVAQNLKERGHIVTVLTGQPNYPDGKIYKGYSTWGFKTEDWNGIKIKRIPLFARGKGKGIRLVLNYISYVIFGLLFGRWVLRNLSFDKIFVFEISPITVAYPAIWIKKKYKIPIFLWVLDLWPETLYALGKLKSNSSKKIANRLVSNIYRHCDSLFISSRSFEKSLTSKGVDLSNIHYVPNWADEINIMKLPTDPKLLNFFESINEKFVIMFAGNLGEAQDIESIICAAEILKENKNIIWIIVGEGRKRIGLENLVKEKELSSTVVFFGRFHSEYMPYFFSKASSLIVSLKAEPVFSLTVPAKLQTYMASEKPVLSMVSGEANTIVKDSHCGLICESGDFVQLAKNALELSRKNDYELQEFGKNGFDFYFKHFSKKNVMDTIDSLIRN